MDEQPIMVGRVLRASTTSYTLGCNQRIIEQDNVSGPEFGAFVKAFDARSQAIYGLIYDVSVEDDAFVRQLVAADVQKPEVIEDQRQNRQVLVSVAVLILGYGMGNQVWQRLPPQPPATLREIYRCNNAEIVRFTEHNDWLRTVLSSADVPVEHLLATGLRAAAAARPPDHRDLYLLGAGRELARLLALDLPRLDGILRQVR
jgi:hypothetical protein